MLFMVVKNPVGRPANKTEPKMKIYYSKSAGKVIFYEPARLNPSTNRVMVNAKSIEFKHHIFQTDNLRLQKVVEENRSFVGNGRDNSICLASPENTTVLQNVITSAGSEIFTFKPIGVTEKEANPPEPKDEGEKVDE